MPPDALITSPAGDRASPRPGSPIRTPWDHSSVDNSPRPIAASHVLHQHLVPRHPPYAHRHEPHSHTRPCTQQNHAVTTSRTHATSHNDARHHYPPVNHHTSEPTTRVRPQRTQQYPNTRAACLLLRKEVIQPHLPVRLPCYDFVPIASPTFDHAPHTTCG